MTDQIQELDQAQDQEQDTHPIENLDQFARAMTYWHGRKVAILRHMKTIPAGTEVNVDDSNLVLEGLLLDGFRLGLDVALAEIGNLPFTAEVEEDTADQANQLTLPLNA